MMLLHLHGPKALHTGLCCLPLGALCAWARVQLISHYTSCWAVSDGMGSLVRSTTAGCGFLVAVAPPRQFAIRLVLALLGGCPAGLGAILITADHTADA
jgi:hypothetical protein